MTPDQYQRVQDLFLRIRELPESERAVALSQADATIAREAASLLASDSRCGSFLEPHPDATAETSVAEFDTAAMPQNVGRYRLLQKIGQGGCGTVFMAEQKEPISRKVAVKLIKPGMDSRQVLARFQAESQALAMMDHPSIAKVFDAGTTETGSPYFVMELVKGVPIHEFCQQNHLDLHERLRLFMQVCSAVHHAHQKGVIHRDIKPSNVLVTMGEAEPLAKVIDFGIAKALDTRLTEQTLFTEFGQMIGTLEYMSPEQAEMSAVDIDTRSDVYSLGVLLYQLLTGETPISREQLLQKGVFEIPRLIRETEPVTPSSRITSRERQLSRVDRGRALDGLSLQRGDLDWVAMKALEKDRRRRYDSALDLSRDIERFLSGDPVSAHPPSISYQLGKFIRRHRIIAAAGSLVLISGVLGVLGLMTGLRQAQLARHLAERERDAAIVAQEAADASARQLAESAYSELLGSAWRSAKALNAQRAFALLESCPRALRGWEWHFVKGHVHSHPYTVLREAGQSAISHIDINLQADIAACVVRNGHVEIRSLDSDRLIHTLVGEFRANVVRFSADGEMLLVGAKRGQLNVYRTRDWSALYSDDLGLGGIYDITISDQGNRFAVCTGGAWVEVREFDTFRSVQKWKQPARLASLTFSMDGDQLWCAGLDGQLYSMHISNAKRSNSFVSEANLQAIQRLGEDRVVVLAGGTALSIDLDDTQGTPEEMLRLQGIVTAMDVDGTGTLAVGGGDGEVSIRPPDQTPYKIADFGMAVSALRWLPVQDELLVSLSDGRVLRMTTARPQLGWFANSRARITAGILLSEVSKAICLDGQGWMYVFDLETGALVSEHQVHDKAAWSVSVDAAERVLATVGDDFRLCCWQLPDMTLKFERPMAWGVRDVCLSPDGSWIAAAPPAASESPEGTIGIWDTETGNCHRLLKGHDNWVIKLAAAPSGSLLVSGCENNTIRVWDVHSGEAGLKVSPSKKSKAEHFAFGRDLDSALFVGHRDGWVTSWNLSDGTAGATWPAFGDALTGLVVTRDKRVVATSRSDARLKVRDIVSARTLAEFDLGVGYIGGLRLSADERSVAIVGENGQVRTIRLPDQ